MTTPGQTAASTSVRGVLFDMDGVLIDSTGADERAWEKWAVFHSMQGTFSIQSTHGRRSVDSIRMLRPDLDPAVEAQRLEAFDAEATDGIATLPGVQNLLAKLRPSQWTIVTSASEALMRRRLECAGIAVPSTVVTADNVSQGKPNPEPYQLAAARLGLAPVECLVIEDAPNGIQAGRLAGCQVLAVKGSHSAAELQEADWIVGSLDRIRIAVSADGWLNFQFETVSP
jgi:mannitol-1-/sugar-/sorbitol-6-phosphatase